MSPEIDTMSIPLQSNYDDILYVMLKWIGMCQYHRCPWKKCFEQKIKFSYLKDKDDLTASKEMIMLSYWSLLYFQIFAKFFNIIQMLLFSRNCLFSHSSMKYNIYLQVFLHGLFGLSLNLYCFASCAFSKEFYTTINYNLKYFQILSYTRARYKCIVKWNAISSHLWIC